MKRWTEHLTTGLLLLVLLFTGAGLYELRALHKGISRVAEHYVIPMQEASSTVTNTAGVTITVRTVRLENEDVNVWMDRHNDAVTAAQNS